MRANAITPKIGGPHYAYPCTCGHKSCKAWFVAGFAEVQGVSFTRDAAIFAADMLNAREDGGRRVVDTLTDVAFRLTLDYPDEDQSEAKPGDPGYDY